MVSEQGAIADPATRAALVRRGVLALAAFVVPLLLLIVGIRVVLAAEARQDDLERDGIATPALILTVSHPVPGIDRASFGYDADGERRTAEMIVFNSYVRGQAVNGFVDPDDPSRVTLAGETLQSGPSWLITVACLLIGLVGIPLGARRLMRTARTWSVLRGHPWTPWTMRAVYPKRRRMAVAHEEGSDEHLIRLDSWGARRMGRLERKADLYLAGSGRWFVATPVEGRRSLALGRMDVPYERFSLVNPDAAPDRFDHEEPSEEVF